MEKIKFFISQPMRNKTNEEIEKERNDIKASAKWVKNIWWKTGEIAMAKTLKEIKDYINTKFDAAKNSFAAAKLKNKQNDKIYALAQVNTLNDILEFMKGDKNGK